MSLRPENLPRYRRRCPWQRLAGLAMAAAVVAATPALATLAVGAEVLSGPVEATVVRVVDGDSLVVRARIWLGQDLETSVRLLGVDAPELRGACEFERLLARRSRAFVVRVVGRVSGAEVRLSDIQLGKFAGRVVARVRTPDGEDLGRALVAAGLARHYRGGRRQSWCRESRAAP